MNSTARIALPLAALLALAGCSGSDPAAPGGTEPPAAETPSIPRPGYPGGPVPATSDTTFAVSAVPLADYAPRLLDIESAAVTVTMRYPSWCPPVVVETYADTVVSAITGNAWHLATACVVENVSYDRGPAQPLGLQVLREDGAWKPSLSKQVRFTHNVFQQGILGMEVEPSSPPAEPPYVRRDRYWQRKPIEGQVGDFLLLTGPVEGSITTSYTAGVARTQSETFGASVTASVGAEIGPLNASISATLSRGFSTSVTVQEQTTETFTKTVRGEEGKTVQFMVWELVEVYSFCDAEGGPYAPENWVMADDHLVRHAAALALDATTFPAE